MNNHFEEILGIKITNLDLNSAFTYAVKLLESRDKYIVTPNPEFLVDSVNNIEFKRALNNAHLSIPDGIGLIYAARILKKKVKNRIPGIELLYKLLEYANQYRKRVFLFGAKSHILKKAVFEIQKKYPNLIVCGAHHGYYNKSDQENVIKLISELKPDILVVGLGSPKQELFVHQNIDKLNTGVAICCGGSLDIISGVIKRAPTLWQKLNLEWMYRLIIQPNRIIRVFKSIFLFIIHLLIAGVKK